MADAATHAISSGTRLRASALISTDALEVALGGIMTAVQRQAAELAAARSQVAEMVPRVEVIAMQQRLGLRISQLEERLGMLEAAVGYPQPSRSVQHEPRHVSELSH